jgi:hypothetical protein
MKQMGFLDGQTRTSTTSQNANNNIFVDQLNPSHVEAMQQLFSNPQEEHLRRRARKHV